MIQSNVHYCSLQTETLLGDHYLLYGYKRQTLKCDYTHLRTESMALSTVTLLQAIMRTAIGWGEADEEVEEDEEGEEEEEDEDDGVNFSPFASFLLASDFKACSSTVVKR